MQEIWKDIAGYDGKYRISNLGRVMSLQYPSKPKILSASRVTVEGYPRVALRLNGAQKEFRVHRIVQAHFIENPENLPEVNHKDGNKQNNVYTNLEWVTHQDNMAHAQSNNLMKSVYGQDNPNYRGRILVLKNGEVVASLCGLEELKSFGLLPSKVYSCLSGSRKSHKGFNFKREELA